MATKEVFTNGQVINNLTVVEDKGTDRAGKTILRMMCYCGKMFTARVANIKNNKTRSCGCLRSNLLVINKTTHNLSGTPLYNVWVGMKKRCDNGQGLYGSVSYQKEWSSFEHFHSDMSEGYIEGLWLDRIDPFSGYRKDNCRWVSLGVSAYNKTGNSRNRTGVTGVIIYGHLMRYRSVITVESNTIYNKATWCLDTATLQRKFMEITYYGEMLIRDTYVYPI